MGCSFAAPAARRRPACRSASSRRFQWLPEPRRLPCLEPHSPVLLGQLVQNGLQKRIEAPEWYFSIRPVIRGVPEDVEQLLARFLVELGVGRDVFEHDDEAGLRA